MVGVNINNTDLTKFNWAGSPPEFRKLAWIIFKKGRHRTSSVFFIIFISSIALARFVLPFGFYSTHLNASIICSFVWLAFDSSRVVLFATP